MAHVVLRDSILENLAVSDLVLAVSNAFLRLLHVLQVLLVVVLGLLVYFLGVHLLYDITDFLLTYHAYFSVTSFDYCESHFKSSQQF